MKNTSQENLEELYNEILKSTDVLCATNNPLAVAGVMTAIAMSIYKTALPDIEFDMMAESIYNNRDKVKTFQGPLLQ